MKRIILSLFSLLLCLSAFAQNSIQVNIHHKLADANFAMETAAVNNINSDFKVTRLDYYISGVSIIHDDSTETFIEDLWVLVKAGEATQIDLGEQDITSVEMLKFHIGVDEPHNHLDPGSYAADHPLAPKNPSMHWGWTSGYRFVAMEGKGGSNLDQIFDLHALGNRNYFTTEIPMNKEAVNGKIVINLDADYTRALEDIDVSAGVIVHGEDLEAKQCLKNFRDYVFSLSAINTSTIDFSEVSQFKVFPNPTNAKVFISLEASQDLNYQIGVTDILGRQVQFLDGLKANSTMDLDLKEAGIYFVHLLKDGQIILTEKVISK